MKIAILINTFYLYKGMDLIAEQQAIELTNSGHDVTIFAFDYNHQINNVKIEKLDWPETEISNLIYRLIFPFDIYKTIKFSSKLKNYDVLICHFYPISYLAFFTKKRYSHIKYIFYNHGIGKDKHSPVSRKIYIYFLKILTKYTISNADMVISISKFIEKMTPIQKNLKKNVLYNKVDPYRFEYEPSHVSKELKNISKSNDPLFLYVGVLTYSKGISLLIESFKRVLDIYPGARLLLVGQISYGFDISKTINEESSKNITYLGHISSNKLGFLYNICDVYVSASVWESFNLPIVEAQLLGTPVVAFDIGAHSEVIHDNETGILVKPFNTIKFSEAMIKVYENREIMGTKAKKWAFKFSTENQDSDSISTFIQSVII